MKTAPATCPIFLPRRIDGALQMAFVRDRGLTAANGPTWPTMAGVPRSSP